MYLWLMGVSYFLTYYRNYHFGAKHGTVDCEEKIIMVDKGEEQFYRNAAATDKTIRFFDIDEEAFLYLNWDDNKPLTMEEIRAIIKSSKKRDVFLMEEPNDVRKTKESEEILHGQRTIDESTPRTKWDLKGSFSECILRYGEELTTEEIEILSRDVSRMAYRISR